ncbi:MAG: class I SAM-dependent methyltransferase [Agathobacter sp.]|nr:class I SAM-dependent methyltransferase [Agathobacter sp.]
MITLSKRMETIASMITPGGVLADVGTDHGYIPIYQVQLHRNPHAIAMDLRKGPLERAREHIGQYGLTGQIETRLSDGVAALKPGEADSIVIAGMGGELILHILGEGETVCRQAKELILQPQSEIAAVRRCLREQGYCINAEDMVVEDGKYYPMMRVCWRGLSKKDELPGDGNTDKPSVLEDLYGPFLLRNAHPVLQQYLCYQREQLLTILKELKKQPDSEKIRGRMLQLEQQLSWNETAGQRMKES